MFWEVTTLEAEVGLIRFCKPRRNLVVPNVCWGMGLHECDILSLSSSGYATEIEIKVSAADLKKDSQKRHGHDSEKIKYFFYAVPEDLVDLARDLIPDHAGLMSMKIVRKHCLVRTVKSAKARKNARKWDDKMRYRLARLGTLRILGLKEKLLRR